MLVFLKDVSYDDIKDSLNKNFSGVATEQVIKDSDVSANRNNIFFKLWSKRCDLHILCIYDFKYLKWSLIYCCLIYFTARKKAYIIEASGKLSRINFGKILFYTLSSIASVIFQVFDALLYKNSLRKVEKFTPYSRDDKPITTSRVAYLRATDTFNLRGGGSLGHTVGLVNAFESCNSPVTFFGIDKLRGLKASKQIIVDPSVFYNLINIFGRFSYNKKMISRASEIIKNEDYKYIYQRASRDNYSGVAISKRFGIPLVLEFNSFLSWELDGANHWIHRLFTRPTAKIEHFNLTNAHIILAVSDVLKDQLIESGYDAQKILVAPNGVDTEKFSPDLPSSIDCKKIGLPTDKIIFGFSGTFSFWHGIDTLVNSIKDVLKERDDICFLLIGDGPGRAPVEEALADYKNVIFTGLIPYELVPQYLNVCDVLLSPHQVPKDENFIGSPTKLYEYMACGKIIIASDLDQISDVISPSMDITRTDNGYSVSDSCSDQIGITVPPGSSAALSFSINSVANNLNSFKFLGANARERAVKKHGWDSVVKSINEKISKIKH